MFAHTHATALIVGCWNILSCAVCPGEIFPNTSQVFVFITGSELLNHSPCFFIFQETTRNSLVFSSEPPLNIWTPQVIKCDTRVQTMQYTWHKVVRTVHIHSLCASEWMHKFSYEKIINVCTSSALNAVVSPPLEDTKGMFTKEKHAHHGKFAGS